MRGFLLISLSAAGFALMPIFSLYAYRDGLNVTTLLFLRFLIAAAIFLPYVWWRLDWGQLVAVDVLFLFILGGVLYAAQSTLYFSSVQHISPAFAVLLLYLYPGLVAVTSAVVNKEIPSVVVMFSIVLSFAGVALALGRIESGVSFVGIVEAVGAAIVYTIYIVFGDRVGLTISPVAISAFVSVFAAASFAFFGIFFGQLHFSFAAVGWLSVLAVAFVSTVLAIFCFFAGMELVGPTKASIGSMLEPVVNIVASVVLLGASMTAMQMVGAAMVLAGSMLSLLSQGNAPTSAAVHEPEITAR